jgi:membrane associated rhomboid family serine protease
MLRTSLTRSSLVRPLTVHNISRTPLFFPVKTLECSTIKPIMITATHRAYTVPPDTPTSIPRLNFQDNMNRVLAKYGFSSRGGYGSRFTGSMTVKLMAINIAIFLLMQLWNNREAEFKHFAVSLFNIKNGRIYTMITSAFTHFDFFHILVNMFVFYSFASQFEAIFGPRRLLQLCIVGGLTASTFFVLEKTYRYVTSKNSQEKIRNYYSAAVGASGVTAAMFACTSMLFPQARMLLFFVIPMPARLLLGLFMLEEGWRMATRRDSTISASGHLGGIFGGLLYYMLLKRGKI